MQENGLSKAIRSMGDFLSERWQKLKDSLEEPYNRLRRLLGLAPAVRGALGSTGTVVVAIFIVLFLIYMIFLLAKYFENRRIAALLNHDKSGPITAVDIDQAVADSVQDPDEWLAEARRLATNDDYRRAIRALFLAVLLLLDRDGIVDFTRSRTNGDYLRLLRTRGFDRLVETFQPFVLDYEVRWYGNRESAARDYERCILEFEVLKRLISDRGNQAVLRSDSSAPQGAASLG